MVDHNGYVDYGDAYMEQEEEWEREGLLDPAWEKQQKKVNSNSSGHFYFWLNLKIVVDQLISLYILRAIKWIVFYEPEKKHNL